MKCCSLLRICLKHIYSWHDFVRKCIDADRFSEIIDEIKVKLKERNKTTNNSVLNKKRPVMKNIEISSTKPGKFCRKRIASSKSKTVGEIVNASVETDRTFSTDVQEAATSTTT